MKITFQNGAPYYTLPGMTEISKDRTCFFMIVKFDYKGLEAQKV